MLGIGQKADRVYLRKRYRNDPVYREKKIKEVKDYQARMELLDPEFKHLKIVRATVCKVRAQIENHEKAIRKKQRRIAELNQKLLDYAVELSVIQKRRKERQCPQSTTEASSLR